MARSRYIKPEFWKDEDLARVSHSARLLFVGLWSLADRSGRLEDRPLRIKAELFPYEDIDVEPILNELATRKAYGNGAFIVRYEIKGRRYIQIANFSKHQKCHVREPNSDLPGPDTAKPVRGTASFRPAGARRQESVTESVTESESDNGVTSSVADAPVAAPAWSSEACDDWQARFGGTAPGGRIGKALKPLVSRYGWETIRPAWRRYLAEKEPEFATPQDFAAKLGEWLHKRIGSAKGQQFVDRTKAVLSEWLQKRSTAHG